MVSRCGPDGYEQEGGSKGARPLKLPMRSNKRSSLAGIQYAGEPGISGACLTAVMRLLQFGDRITLARILSCSNEHCLLLTVNVGDLIAVKSGFGSGYRGEGSHAFSYVLELLDVYKVSIEEYEVNHDVIERLDSSSLTMADIDKLDVARPVRPTRWPDYVFEEDWKDKRKGTIWSRFPVVIPLAIIDERISELAMSFWEGPDDKLLTGYRRLEDIVRKRTGLKEHGAKLFSQAFEGPTAKLGWKGLDSGEQTGRGLLFKSAYLAHRNPRAHREMEEYGHAQLAEFLILNHLFLIEKEAVKARAGKKRRQGPLNIQSADRKEIGMKGKIYGV